MAITITWDVDIQIIDLNKAAARVIAVRTVTDDTDPLNIITTKNTYGLRYAIIGTPAERVAALNKIWSQHQDRVAAENSIATFIGTLEADAKANLEARE